ncbi:hypothetical protein GWE18_00450 [Bradyrhizobium sp. CSA112]|uniref:hypothetical protein n=1 Tax=Bradyrhizobium sp. CSA112 TaxID=2699170 RepID=UPI0023AEC40A|nr:hypothetical protein [Bradyrhizobium sp. CSA112]MDE5451346.1 hypothetical protein [Bradyrhizobium sp. CSA112]
MSDDIQRSLGRVEAKVDLLLDRESANNKRISAVEKKVWYASGASAVVAFFATHLIGKH